MKRFAQMLGSMLLGSQLFNPVTWADQPKLVLQITVDQLRGDMIDRFSHHIGKGGFQYLLDNGVVYKNAHHAHSNTETIVGHATLATGAYPADHGMIGNVWYDRSSGRLVYNVEDYRYPLLSEDAGVNQQTEIDPTQRKARSSGRSPSNILVSTFSDELRIHSGGRSKVFAVSVKDRGAISMAGHAGQAYWFSKQKGTFVTSSFYAEQYPDWVVQWNARKPANDYGNKVWSLLHDRNTYLFAEQDDRPWEVDFPGYGRVFPHNYGDPSSKYYNTLLTLSPAGDELTVDFALTLLERERLGLGQATDYLSVSLSSTDYVGHFFGPSSLEAEDNFARLDEALTRLLRAVDRQVGLKKTLIAFSADHGAAEVEGYLQQYGFGATYVDTSQWNTKQAFASLHEQFGVDRALIKQFYQPYIYLNQELIKGKGLDQAEVEKAVAAELAKLDGVAMALTRSQLDNGEIPANVVSQLVLNNHNAVRSGDIYVVFEPHRFINDLDGLKVASTHGSPWAYDTHVPIIFAGSGIRPLQVFRRVETVDVARTLAAWIGTKAPSGASGNVLTEVLRHRR